MSHEDHESVARDIAAAALTRVWRDQAFASAALDAELQRHPRLDARDAGLATELTYGVLRTEAWLDERVLSKATRHKTRLEPRARAHLLMGAYSILLLDRVPPFAAVSQAVTGAKREGGHRLAGFVNAVLRRVAAEAATAPRPSMEDAVAAAAPGWLRGALRRTLGRKGASAYLAAGPVPPPMGLCVANAETRLEWQQRLQTAAPEASVELGGRSPHALLVRGAGDVRRLPGYEDAWIVQEEGAQVVALETDAQPGERVLDACAGRGNKAWLLARKVGDAGTVDAVDLYAHKLATLEAGARRETVGKWLENDWTRGPGEVPGGYDRVLVDAPCSGIGTLRRRPEIGGRRTAEDVARLAGLQVAITRAAATRARDGGTLVYAVCSVLREEGEEVIAALTEGTASGESPGVVLTPLGEPLRLLPHEGGTDGYFVTRLRVRHPG